MLTAQQALAIDTRDVSIGLSAGAGCGKTFVLTRRFLSQLEPGFDPERLSRLVAITFTERAAREMRQRIRLACQDRLDGCAADDVEHWQRVLRGLDSARISTIHSFCGSLLRAQAVELGIDPNFDLLDAGTGRIVQGRVVREHLRRALENGDDSARLLVRHYGLERTRELLRDILAQPVPETREELCSLSADDLILRWQRMHSEAVIPLLLREFIDSETVRRTRELLTAENPDHEKMSARRTEVLSTLSLLRDRIESDAAFDPLPLLEELTANAQVQGGGGKSVWRSEEVYESVRETLKELRESVKKITKAEPPEVEELEHSAELSVACASVCNTLWERYDNHKRETGLLDFNDLLVMTRDLLRDSEPVRERLARGIDFLMVDEFQDTDPVQADIVRMLCGERFANGKLFLVGDAKQSIYRFRGADPRVFQAMRNELPEPGRLPLSMNFRSQPPVLHIVNQVFSEAIGKTYEALTPHRSEATTEELPIELLLANRPADPNAPVPEKPDVRTLRRWEADWLARRIAYLIHEAPPCIPETDPETNTTRLRRAKPGDVCLLFRTLGDVSVYEQALREWGLEYYLVGGRAFFAQQEIFDVANLCQTLDDPDDAISLAGVLRSPFFSLTDETLFALAEVGGTLREGVWNWETYQQEAAELLDEPEWRRVGFASRTLRELQTLKDRLTLVELLNLALSRTGYDAALLSESLGARKLANLRKLIEQARDFDEAGLFTLKEFVVRLRESVAETFDEELAATHAETSDVVRLMTIHQSKGLEFPIVCVVDIARKEGSRPESASFDEQLGPLLTIPKRHGNTCRHLGREVRAALEREQDRQENLRLFYVAMTRASDRLILSAGLDGFPKRGQAPWLDLITDHFDAETGANLHPDPEQHLVPQLLTHPEPSTPKKPKLTKQGGKIHLAKVPELIEQADPTPFDDFALASMSIAPGVRTIDLEASLPGDAKTLLPLLRRWIGLSLRFDDPDPRTMLTRHRGSLPAADLDRLSRWMTDWLGSGTRSDLQAATELRWNIPLEQTVAANDRPPLRIRGRIDCLSKHDDEWRAWYFVADSVWLPVFHSLAERLLPPLLQAIPEAEPCLRLLVADEGWRVIEAGPEGSLGNGVDERIAAETAGDV